MSPHRMNISSLLRDPTPPPHPHPPPASLLHILNDPDPLQPPPRLPFLGLDALVHVASEERRRIAAVPDSHLQRDLHSLVHDHDRPSSLPLHPPPLHRHPDIPSFLQDSLGTHRRTLAPSPPRSPSPKPSFPPAPSHGQLTSPRTRQYPSASPTNGCYPTLRQQPILHIEPTRTTPAFLINDARVVAHPPPLSLQHSSPFLHSPHPPLISHSSPRNSSPHRHSPQHFRMQHHSPVHTGPLIPASVEPDIMSPRFSYGPRMAGGIEILSNDPSTLRDPPRLDFSNYQSPNISPLSARAFPPNDDRHQAVPPPHRLDGQESGFLRERVRSRPPHLSLCDPTTDIASDVCMLAVDADFPSHPSEHHPIRVWEERQAARETPRRISPVHTQDIVSGLVQARAWSTTSEIEHRVQPTMEDHATAFRQDLVEIVPTPPLSTCKEPPPQPHHQPSALLASVSQTPVERTCLDPQSSLPIPVQSEPRACLSQTSSLNSLTVSPVLDLHLENFENQSELRPEHLETQADADTGVSLASSAEPVHVDADANPPLRQPSPEPVRPVLDSEPGTFGMVTQSTHARVSQNSRSLSQPPFPVPFPAKGVRNPSPKESLASPPIRPEPSSRQSPGLEHINERELPVLEQAMMDVDEEFLSLVEDHPVCTATAMPKTQIDSMSPRPIKVSQAISSGTERHSRETSDGSSLVPSSQPVLRGPLIADEEKDRASMPPPTARNRKTEKDKATSAAATSRRKKDGTSKPAVRAKPPPKPRAKPIPKPKVKPNAADPSLKAGIPRGVVNANARSRSTSVIPGAMDDAVPELEADDGDKEDDKLYCVCKTRYDEDRMMIACDRCDEWFHTLCVSMPDLEIDLVDQFICPPCIQKHPHLRTTWKRRCLYGLQHENPSSPEACHKPSRGVFSKYCSDDCGIKYMQARIAEWEKSGGARDLLWESVKNASKREGVVVFALTSGPSSRTIDADSNTSNPRPLDSVAKRRAEREVSRLNLRLEEVVKERELMKRDLDLVTWREKVVELASERAGKIDECGWDHRLCFGEEEWAEFGSDVLESYEERVKAEPGDDAMPLDAASAMYEEWWCAGKKKCERHAGWQKLRAAEVSFDRETKEGILLKLTTREREIRKCIEDILYPQPTGALHAPPHPEVQLNGPEKPRSTGHVSERGKKGHRRCV